jgi:hypothetical protein
MMKKFYFLLPIVVLIFGVLELNLIVAQSVTSQSKQQPRESENEDYSDIAISTSRGGCNHQTPSLTWILPPKSERMTNKSAYVLLHLENSANSFPSNTNITITLSNSQTKKTVEQKEVSLRAKAAQFIPISLDEVQLEHYVDYIITVMLVCDPLQKSANPWKRVLIKKFPDSEKLDNQLPLFSSDLAQAKFLKANLVGYDAIKKTFSYYTQPGNSEPNKQELLETLNQL